MASIGCTDDVRRWGKLLPAVCLLVAGVAEVQAATPSAWRAKVQQELPLLGHRNWIVVVDSAYPLQVSPGVETIETGASEEVVLRAVLGDLAKAPHVSPTVFTDAELPFLTEQSAPGVTAYRSQVHAILGSMPEHSVRHEDLIRSLDEAGKTFHVLILKTTLTVPYTSVFFRLDCRYWSDSSEEELRRVMSHERAR